MIDILILLAGFAAAFLATGRLRRYLTQRQMLDTPNERSSHKIAVPRGGGWAVVAIVLPGMALAALWQHDFARHAGLIAGAALLAAVSWIDDRRGLPPLPRLACHILAAWLGTLGLTPDETLFDGLLPLWLDRGIVILGWAWFVNLYNFMDGIDGITGVESIALVTGACLTMSYAGMNYPFVMITALLVTGACLGFLAHNWHPARIFLGDVGSVPLGFVTGYGLVILAMHGLWLPAFILPLYYLADSGITIARRAARGERIWQAHRQHFYQRASAGIGRHDRVVIWIALADIALVAASLTAIELPWIGAALAIAIVALLLVSMHKAGASRPSSRRQSP